MKQLKEFINEKLHVGQYKGIDKKFPKFTQYNVVNKIIYYFALGMEDDSSDKIIEWVKEYDVEDIIPVAWPITIEEYVEQTNMPKDIAEEFAKHNPEETCEECDEYFEKAKKIFEYEDGAALYASDKIFCYHNTDLGNLYALVKK